jgi:hypothetical protein
MKSAPKAVTALAALAALGAAAAPTAGAAKSSDSDCGNPAGSKIFSQFGDQKNYFLAPDGGFEGGGDGWGLNDGAAVVDGNESFDLNAAGDAKSLSLPAGSSATSPAVCVTRKHPQFRFVAKRTPAPAAAAKGSTRQPASSRGTRPPAPRLRVEIVYLNGKGHKKTRTAAKLRAGQEWKATRKIAIATGRATGRGRHKTGDIQIRFTPIGGAADWQIDDLYVDPHARR